MSKKKTTLTSRSWRPLRLAQIWARKGDTFKHMLDLRTIIHNIRSNMGDGNISLKYYLEREFSLDESPAFIFKMHLPSSMRSAKSIPCIRLSVDFDNDSDFMCPESLKRSDEKEEEGYFSNGEELDCEIALVVEEKGIDSQAEEFIERFYEQMKFKRQISLLEYNEMLYRGMS